MFKKLVFFSICLRSRLILGKMLIEIRLQKWLLTKPFTLSMIFYPHPQRWQNPRPPLRSNRGPATALHAWSLNPHPTDYKFCLNPCSCVCSNPVHQIPGCIKRPNVCTRDPGLGFHKNVKFPPARNGLLSKAPCRPAPRRAKYWQVHYIYINHFLNLFLVLVARSCHMMVRVNVT